MQTVEKEEAAIAETEAIAEIEVPASGAQKVAVGESIEVVEVAGQEVATALNADADSKFNQPLFLF